MNRKKILTLLVFAVLIIGAIALVNIIEMSTKETNTETEVAAETDTAGDSTKSSASSSASSEKETAEQLIGKTISREEIEKNVGKWEEFEMSSAGCERGVYAGEFSYKDFKIFSRTYNKGKTFRIISVNE